MKQNARRKNNQDQKVIQEPYIDPYNVKFDPITLSQRKAWQALRRGTGAVFLVGSAGTGKSMLAAAHAAMLLKSKRINKILLLRPAVGVGKTIGFLKGTLEEKMAPYFAQIITHLNTFLGAGMTTYSLEHKVIEMGAVEYTRGRSFENMLVIVEESQNLTKDEFEMMLTRLGDKGQMVFTGDEKQNDLKGSSGLRQTINLLDKMIETKPRYLTDEDLEELNKNIEIVQFTPDDVVRSGLCKAIVNIYNNN